MTCVSCHLTYIHTTSHVSAFSCVLACPQPQLHVPRAYCQSLSQILGNIHLYPNSGPHSHRLEQSSSIPASSLTRTSPECPGKQRFKSRRAERCRAGRGCGRPAHVSCRWSAGQSGGFYFSDNSFSVIIPLSFKVT